MLCLLAPSERQHLPVNFAGLDPLNSPLAGDATGSTFDQFLIQRGDDAMEVARNVASELSQSLIQAQSL